MGGADQEGPAGVVHQHQRDTVHGKFLHEHLGDDLEKVGKVYLGHEQFADLEEGDERLQPDVLLFQTAAPDRTSSRTEQFLLGEGFEDETVYAAHQGLDSRVQGAVACDKNRHQVKITDLDPLKELQPVDARHLDVRDQEVYRRLLQFLQRRGPVRNSGHLISLGRQDMIAQVPDHVLVVNDENLLTSHAIRPLHLFRNTVYCKAQRA